MGRLTEINPQKQEKTNDVDFWTIFVKRDILVKSK